MYLFLRRRLSTTGVYRSRAPSCDGAFFIDYIDRFGAQTKYLHKKEMIPIEKVTTRLHEAITAIYYKEPEKALEHLYKALDILGEYEYNQNTKPTFTNNLGGVQFVFENMGKRSA